MIQKTTIRWALALLLLAPAAALADNGGKAHGKKDDHAKEAKGKPDGKGKDKGKDKDKDGKHEGHDDEGERGKKEDRANKGDHNKHEDRGEEGEHGKKEGHANKDAKGHASDIAKINAEQRKHIKNNARIDRLEELAKEKPNDKLSERIPTLRDKEKRRHDKAMSRIKPADAPAADAPAPADAPQ